MSPSFFTSTAPRDYCAGGEGRSPDTHPPYFSYQAPFQTLCWNSLSELDPPGPAQSGMGKRCATTSGVELRSASGDWPKMTAETISLSPDLRTSKASAVPGGM